MPDTPHLFHVVLRGLLAMGLFAGTLAQAATGQDSNQEFLGPFFPYGKFPQLRITPIAAPGGTLEVAFAPGELRLPRQTIVEWVGQRVQWVTAYFGRLPDSEAKLLVVPVSGKGVRGGTTWGWRGAASRILVGRDTGPESLREDWILVHELIHHAMPMLDDKHHWMEEGLATYVESVARAQAGNLSAEAAWGDLVKGLPHGLPRAGDRGLDHTPTWGRTYWGGALYFLLADIEIRRRTANRRGLQDALRALVAAGANIRQEWPIEKVLAAADAGTGTTALRDTYEQMKDLPAEPDLQALWRELGVVTRDGGIGFDDDAPLAHIRIEMMRSRSP